MHKSFKSIIFIEKHVKNFVFDIRVHLESTRTLKQAHEAAPHLRQLIFK